ncbi:hypothetical protein K7432_010263 [Basidiobolus ranarum]|uniref:Uncharacterized protein n=1 Tax=Basidiobolus ranarum TaxID=34480 RepID=A0ABR2VVX2_9FUNG
MPRSQKSSTPIHPETCPEPTIKPSIKRKLSSMFTNIITMDTSSTSAVDSTPPELSEAKISNKISQRLRSFTRFFVKSFQSKRVKSPSMSTNDNATQSTSFSTHTTIRKYTLKRTTQTHIHSSISVTSPKQIQYTYNISMRKLRKLKRRPLVQVLLIHQTMSKTKIDLQRDASNFSRSKSSTLPLLVASSKTPQHNCKQDDNVPLGLLHQDIRQHNAPIIKC